MDSCDRLAFRAVNASDSAMQAAAVTTHVPTTQATVGRAAATSAAIIATTPTAAIPHPEMAVNVPARSIVSRMKRRLSSALSLNAGSRSTGGGRSGLTVAMVDATQWAYDCQALFAE